MNKMKVVVLLSEVQGFLEGIERYLDDVGPIDKLHELEGKLEETIEEIIYSD